MNPTATSANRHVRVVLSTAPLFAFTSVSKATALALTELGVGVFFAIGVARSGIGESAPWFVLAACVLSAMVRAIDIESWSFFVPGGLVGRTERAFGPRLAGVAEAAVLVERLLLASLASVLCAQYTVSFAANWTSQWAQEMAALTAITLIGLLWLRTRFGIPLPASAVARGVWIAVLPIAITIVMGIVAVRQRHLPVLEPTLTALWQSGQTGSPIQRGLWWLTSFAVVLPLLGGGGALGRVAQEFAPPRLESLRRTSFFVVSFVTLLTVIPAFLFHALIPARGTGWAGAPLSGLVQNLNLGGWASIVFAVLITASAFLLLVPAVRAGLEGGEQILRRLSAEGTLPGSSNGATNIAAAMAVLVTVAVGAQVAWLSHAYGIAIAVGLILRIATMARLRKAQSEPGPFRTPLNFTSGQNKVPLGGILVGVLVAVSATAMILARDVPSIATLSAVGFLGLVLAGARRRNSAVAVEEDPFELSTSGDVSLGQVEAGPDNVLVGVRRPHAISHVVAALQAAGDRDVVVVSVRVLGVDVGDEAGDGAISTPEERRLFAQVVALTERFGRPVKLLIVPAQNVYDGLAAVALRLRSSEIYVGESSAVTVDEQARFFGEAWERAEKDPNQQLRLVIPRLSGRTDAYHLGAHPPSLTPGDLELIHRVWLDAVKAIGPHVHHHNVVRAALTQMEQQLTGPQRDEALAVIRNVARPADELAAAVRAGNYSRLRDLVRNRHASDLAVLLTDLAIEEQVIVFRLLPRKDAAAVFEYLSLEQQETLLKAMAQEDVAALLNSMAPDDRTMFLEELPAAVTRQLLTLLTPAERTMALRLLGYPEDSIGRLMTPDFVSVREHWTIRESLDYIRTHGQDSETLNVIYVVDEHGVLVDDIRIREFLLTSPDSHVSDLMDRRFVALKAIEDQKTAIGLFRQYDRTALPVTDTVGMLIGIVTIDDVLDVAEAAATREIQKIGGSEALDEPYMKIAFASMVRKRAGWLTALFLGETLTATAMGVFEGEIQKVVTLALFIPLIISSGGNSGSQAATLVIRALALGEIGIKDWWRIVRREVMTGLALGTILGTVGFLRISIWSAFLPTYGPHWLLVAITVGLALVGVVLWGSLIGSVLPLFLRRLGFDPATSSAPFVATLVDVTGLVIYFTVAMVVLRGTLL